MELEGECASKIALIMIIALIKVIKKYFYTENSNLINKLKGINILKAPKYKKICSFSIF